MALSSNVPEGENFDDSDHEEEEDQANHEEKNVPFDGRIRRKKIDVPPEIMNMVKSYTTWQTMEDLDTAETECYGVPSDFDTTDLKIELGKMEELSSKLNAYHFRYASYIDELDQEVENSLHRIVQLFPGIQSMEAYIRLSEDDKYRIEVTLDDDEVDSDPEDTTDAAETYLPDTADAETNLERMLGPLVSNMEKVRATSKLSVASAEVRSRVRSLMGTLEATVDRCSRYMDNNGRGHKRLKLAEPAKEVPVSEEEKFQSLCKVMKKVLGARVEDVVVSDRFGSSSSCCFMRESGMGGMTMEINPEHRLIKDLHKRLYQKGGTNDLHVETLALVLFNYANGSKEVQSCMDELKMVQDQYYLNCDNARQQVQFRMDELKKLQDQYLNLKMFQDQYLNLLEPVQPS